MPFKVMSPRSHFPEESYDLRVLQMKLLLD